MCETELDFGQVEKSTSEGNMISFIKGAPERVLAKCTTFLKDGKRETITPEFREAYDRAYDVSHTLAQLSSNLSLPVS